jgi:hypothetical protein
MEGKDKHSKIKEALKKALKEADLITVNRELDTAKKNYASKLQKKAALLNQPGIQP